MTEVVHIPVKDVSSPDVLVPIFYINSENHNIHVMICRHLTFRQTKTDWMCDSSLQGQNFLADVDMVEFSGIFSNWKDAMNFVHKNT